MAEKLDDLSVPMKPVRPPVPISIPALPWSSTSSKESESGSGPSPIRPDMEQARRRTMIVGREVRLSGDIKSCNRLVVEGHVEAMLHDCRDMEIAENGLFRGHASSEHAEIHGRFEGELVVSKRLLIRASGHVSGTISYAEIEIERGGKVLGIVQENGLIQEPVAKLWRTLFRNWLTGLQNGTRRRVIVHLARGGSSSSSSSRTSRSS